MKQRAFTIIELLVVISVITILTAIVLVSYRTGEQQLALQRAATKLAQDIRRAQEMAMSAKELSGVGVPSGGYGIYFKQVNDTSYLIYADINGDEQYDSVNDTLVGNIIDMERGVKISALSPGPLSINFKPPDPAIMLGGSPLNDEVTIQIALITDISKTKTIKVNKAGRIDIIN